MSEHTHGADFLPANGDSKTATRRDVVVCIFLCFGVFVLLHVAMLLFILFFAMPGHGVFPDNTGLARFAIVIGLEVVVAAGLFKRKKWAAVCMSAALAGLSYFFAASAYADVPFPFALFDYAISAALLVPVIVSAVSWPYLK